MTDTKKFYSEAMKCPYIKKASEDCPFIKKQVDACPFLTAEKDKTNETDATTTPKFDDEKEEDDRNAFAPITTSVTDNGLLIPSIATFHTKN